MSKRFLCKQCILPSTFPGISFNENGICNHCQRYKGEDATIALQDKYEKKFLKLLEEKKSKAGYDVIVAYSGGKDSTYTLDVFVNRYNMKVLALTFDNTFISAKALENIGNVCGSLGVDSLIIKPAPKVVRNIFRTAAKQELYSAKTLERASTICTSCIGMVKGVVLRTALEKQIPFVGFGWSPGQAPVQASVMRTNPALMQGTQKAIRNPLQKIAGDAILPYFVTDESFINFNIPYERIPVWPNHSPAHFMKPTPCCLITLQTKNPLESQGVSTKFLACNIPNCLKPESKRFSGSLKNFSSKNGRFMFTGSTSKKSSFHVPCLVSIAY